MTRKKEGDDLVSRVIRDDDGNIVAGHRRHAAVEEHKAASADVLPFPPQATIEQANLDPIFDWVIGWAVDFLKVHGSFANSALVLTTRSEAAKLEAKGHSFEKLEDFGVLAKDEDLVAILVDMGDIEDKTTYHRLLAIHDGEEIADALRMMEHLGKSRPDVKDVFGSIVRGYYRASGAHPKDVLMEYMRMITSLTRARAVIAVLESWYREGPPPEGFTGSYADLPDSKEGLWCQLVTRSSIRAKAVRFRRDDKGHARGKGPIVEIEEPLEAGAVRGRMSEFFRPGEEQPS
jgi:hypothetical protein